MFYRADRIPRGSCVFLMQNSGRINVSGVDCIRRREEGAGQMKGCVMKNIRHWIWIFPVVLLTACASCPSLPTVGPPPTALAPSIPGSGSLIVYSPWSCFDNYLTSDHSGYMIYSNDGKLVKWVPNGLEGDFTIEPPTRVKLPTGSYKVKAEGGKYGWINVPIEIKEGQTTCLYLDGEHHAIDALASGNSVVKLPDGEVIGFAADGTVN